MIPCLIVGALRLLRPDFSTLGMRVLFGSQPSVRRSMEER